MRIALGMEYFGAGFRGWQSQADGHTVQDALEEALSRIANERIRTHCAGRTDAGVHASQQVVHFDTGASRPITAWVRGVNATLPTTASVKWAKEVGSDFHARFSAYGRRYRYLLINRPQRLGLWRGRCGWFHAPLTLDSMHRACALLVGRHDFSTFRAAECQAKSPVRTMWAARVRQSGNLFVFDFTANGFLHHMVRNLVGSLVHIGKGAQPVDWMRHLLEARDRSQAAQTFSAEGLYFGGPMYPSQWEIPDDCDDFWEDLWP